MVTLKDIGKAANVSVASVSKVINGDYSRVSDSTKNRILRIAKELNYRPNRLARSLVINRTNILGLIVPDITNPYFAELARGVEDRADAYGYNVILCNTDDDDKKESSYTDVLMEYSVDGVLVTGNERASNENILQLKSCNIPFVTIDRNLGEEAYSAFVDNFRGSYIATEHIIMNGHTKIAFIGGESSPNVPPYRLNGYLKALQDNNINIDKNLITVGNYHMETGYENAKMLLNSELVFTAIVCGNDLIAFGALKAIREKGLRVPQDISLVGYDDIYLTSLIEPRLSTIKQPIYEIGSYAAEILIRLLKNQPIEEKQKWFIPQLVERESVLKIR